MGGKGSGRPPKPETLIKRNSQEVRTPIASEMFLPNLSGDHSKGKVITTPSKDVDIVNKKYVDDNDSKITVVTSNPASADEGTLILNSSNHSIYVYYSSDWRLLHTISIGEDYLLLEIGDYILLEIGDKIIIE